MRGAVDQPGFQVNDRKAGENARSQLSFETLLDCRDELLRHRAADYVVFEFETGPGGRRLSNDLDAGELAVAAGLLLMGVIDSGRSTDFLAIGNMRRADIGIDRICALEDVDLDVEMQFAHALDDGLAG